MWTELCPPETHIAALTYRLSEWVCVSVGYANLINEGEGIGGPTSPAWHPYDRHTEGERCVTEGSSGASAGQRSPR